MCVLSFIEIHRDRERERIVVVIVSLQYSRLRQPIYFTLCCSLYRYIVFLTHTHRYKHPKTVAFHFFFRTAAVLTYLLCGFFSDNFVTNFVVIVILLSFDFWVVKNVSGRFLVGLRWWNKVMPDGNTQWVFESRKVSRERERESHLLYGYYFISSFHLLLYLY